MNKAPRRTASTDPLLLLEACLVILLAALFLFLYVVPTRTRLSDVPWWSPVLLGGLLFGLLLFHTWRRKRRNRREMKAMIEEQLGDEL
jgi:hypothetical protein